MKAPEFTMISDKKILMLLMLMLPLVCSAQKRLFKKAIHSDSWHCLYYAQNNTPKYYTPQGVEKFARTHGYTLTTGIETKGTKRFGDRTTTVKTFQFIKSSDADMHYAEVDFKNCILASQYSAFILKNRNNSNDFIQSLVQESYTKAFNYTCGHNTFDDYKYFISERNFPNNKHKNDAYRKAYYELGLKSVYNYKYYVDNFAGSPNIQNIEETAFGIAKRINNDNEYETFIKYWPTSTYVNQVYKLALDIASRNNTIDRYKYYFDHYPNSTYTQDAHKLAYNMALTFEHQELIKDFLDNIPNTPYKNEVYKKALEIAHKKNAKYDYKYYYNNFKTSPYMDKNLEYAFELLCQSNKLSDYKEFLQNYNNAYANDVYTKALEVAHQNNKKEDYKYYYDNLSNSPYMAQNIRYAYELLCTSNELSDYRNFLTDYPKSIHESDLYQKAMLVADNKNTIDQYNWYFDIFKSSPLLKNCAEKSLKLTIASNNLKPQENFVSKYKGTYPDLVDKLIKSCNMYERSYKACSSEWDYSSYMSLYGEKSPFYSKAQSNYQSLKRQRERREEEERRRREEEEERRRQREAEREARYASSYSSSSSSSSSEGKYPVGTKVYTDVEMSGGTFGINVRLYGIVEKIESYYTTKVKVTNYEILSGFTYDKNDYSTTARARKEASEKIGTIISVNRWDLKEQ